MSKEIIKDELIHLLDTIVEQTQTVCTYQHKVPQIEIDILMKNVRSFYEQLMHIQKQSVVNVQPNKMNAATPTITASAQLKPNQLFAVDTTHESKIKITENPLLVENEKLEQTLVSSTSHAVPKIELQPAAVMQQTQPEPAPAKEMTTQSPQPEVVLQQVAEQVEMPIQTESVKLKATEVQPTPVVAPVQKVAEQIDTKIAFETPASATNTPADMQQNTFRYNPTISHQVKPHEPIDLKSKKVVKTAASLFDAPQSVASVFDDAPTVAAKIATQQAAPSIADKMHHQKIADLKKAIGINDKFLFINELFEGSLASYNEHIEKINVAVDVNHAHAIVDSLIGKYGWDGSQAIVKKFKDLVDRRFLAQ